MCVAYDACRHSATGLNHRVGSRWWAQRSSVTWLVLCACRCTGGRRLGASRRPTTRTRPPRHVGGRRQRPFVIPFHAPFGAWKSRTLSCGQIPRAASQGSLYGVELPKVALHGAGVRFCPRRPWASSAERPASALRACWQAGDGREFELLNVSDLRLPLVTWPFLMSIGHANEISRGGAVDSSRTPQAVAGDRMDRCVCACITDNFGWRCASSCHCVRPVRSRRDLPELPRRKLWDRR
jgi:hypothetical protein